MLTENATELNSSLGIFLSYLSCSCIKFHLSHRRHCKLFKANMHGANCLTRVQQKLEK